ncbi:hypothetical protein QC762_600786 [Podospora pseudocomata]|uniref:Uncharacterized protein n=1 Tax=Podospora pseudocomata TaxID=2093779 RepID=A0ABR0G7N6_9PEZI|nr:hypothetical protein QC762_600786 [Podospora pseudocomata]
MEDWDLVIPNYQTPGRHNRGLLCQRGCHQPVVWEAASWTVCFLRLRTKATRRTPVSWKLA